MNGNGRGFTRRDFLGTSAVAAGAALGLTGTGLSAFAGQEQEKKAGKSLLILGGTAFLGPQLVEAARKGGWTLTLFNRGKTNPQLFPDVEKLRGDRKNDLKALEGRAWDAVIDTSGYFPKDVAASAGLLSKKTGLYVFVSTISVYADTSKPGIEESAPVATTPNPAAEKVTGENYGALKALCEQAAEKAMPGKVTVVRPGLIVGPGDETDRFSYWPLRVRRGGEILAPGDGRDPVQVIDARDLAEWTVRMAEHRVFGRFNAMGPNYEMGMDQLLYGIHAVTGGSARFSWVPVDFLEAQKVSAWGDMPAWVPGVGDSAGFARHRNQRAIVQGLSFRPLADTVAATLAWFDAQTEERRATVRAGIKPEREAEVLAAWKARASAG